MARKGTTRKQKPKVTGQAGSAEGKSRSTDRRFLVVFDVERPRSPYAETEHGPDGAVDAAYVPELRRWFREEFVAVPRRGAVKAGYIVLEGTARYEKLGFASGDTGQIRVRLRESLKALLVDQTGSVDPIVTLDERCRIEVSYCRGTIVDSHIALWQAAGAGSSPGMWNRTAVPGPRQEETVMAEEVEEVVDGLRRLNDEAVEVLRPVVEKTQKYLWQLEGRSFGSLDNNKLVAAEMQKLLNRLSCRVACPRKQCGEPATVECRPAGKTKHGAFQFRHPRKEGGNVIHSGSVKLPRLTVVPAPVSVRRKVDRKKS